MPIILSTATGVIAVVAVLILAGCTPDQQAVNPSEQPLTAQESIAPVTSDAAPATEVAPSTYANGEYTVDGAYQTPAGEELIGVTLTLAEGIIESISVEQKAKAPISKKMQADFADNYESMVVGKSIDEVELTKVSGSSLTPKGFNDALEKIRSQASTS